MTSSRTVVAVVSPKGGVGKTSLVANLATALADQDRDVLVVDLDPQNALRLHLQMPGGESHGVATQGLLSLPASAAEHDSVCGVRVLPYGALSENDRRRFETLLGQDPGWLARELEQIWMPEGGLILIDTPPGGTVYLQQALMAANVALMVLLPDAASFVTIPNMERWLDDYSRPRPEFIGAYYVVNRMNSARELCRDVLAAMQRELGARVVPHPLRFDALLEEALASQQPVSRYAPESMAARDVAAIAGWLTTQV